MVQKAVDIDYGNSQQCTADLFQGVVLQQAPDDLYAIYFITVYGCGNKQCWSRFLAAHGLNGDG